MQGRWILGGLLVLLTACSSSPDPLRQLMDAEPSLTRLERQVDWTIAAATDLNPAPEGLAAEQVRWRKGLIRCLEAEDPANCLAEAHRERLAELQERFGLNPRQVAVHAAGQAGFRFRAVGNEPGWNLRLADDHAIWETNYGQVRHEIPDLRHTVEGDEEVFRGQLEGKDFEARIFDESCADDMSGTEYPLRAEIRYDGKTLPGCADPTAP